MRRQPRRGLQSFLLLKALRLRMQERNGECLEKAERQYLGYSYWRCCCSFVFSDGLQELKTSALFCCTRLV